MKSVLFITKVSFLDAALEYISEVREHVQLHVLIEIDPNSCRKNILDVASLPLDKSFADPSAVLGEEDLAKLQPYMQGCRSFAFMIHRSAKSVNLQALRDSFALYRYIRRIRPDVLHFDDVSIRLLSLLIFLRKSRKIIVNVHDPVPHSGEHDWRYMFAKSRYFARASKVLTFSQYSQRLFRQRYGGKPACLQVRLQPYRVYRTAQEKKERKYLTFIGRLSRYKGIDLFLDATRLLAEKYPQQQFMIAGKPEAGFDMSFPDDPQLRLLTRHLSTAEMSDIIGKSLALVCPYRDATQSGVIMTAYALGTPVIVTDTGGLPEYVEEGFTGYITGGNAPALAEACERFVRDNTLADKLGRNILDAPARMAGKAQIMEIYG